VTSTQHIADVLRQSQLTVFPRFASGRVSLPLKAIPYERLPFAASGPTVIDSFFMTHENVISLINGGRAARRDVDGVRSKCGDEGNEMAR
jgi:hypothetical protein